LAFIIRIYHNARSSECQTRKHNTNSNSFQFIGYLLTCRLNSTSAYYTASTK